MFEQENYYALLKEEKQTNHNQSSIFMPQRYIAAFDSISQIIFVL